MTHLFADGGRILSTLRTDYREQLGRPDLADYVREQMRAQHKSLYLSLRGGELDALIEEAYGPLSLPPNRLPSSQFSLPPELASTPSRSLTPTRRHAVQPSRTEPSAVHTLPVPEVVKQRQSSPPTRRISGEVPVAPAPQRASPRRSEPPQSSRGAVTAGPAVSKPAPSRVERPAQMRPAARSAALPIPQFQPGDGISEQSLDDVILSCLADELEAPSK